MNRPIANLEARLVDITRLDVDAIVNAANPSLLGGAGVDGAIHRAAGPALRDACSKLAGCAPGEARITPGFALPARFVIHTVGPIWRGGTSGEATLLAHCYQRSLQLARDHNLHSIAFPAISCGVYRYPLDEAVAIAVREVRAWVAGDASITHVIFACFDATTLAAYQVKLNSVD